MPNAANTIEPEVAHARSAGIAMMIGVRERGV
jgi:hypothetical protein